MSITVSQAFALRVLGSIAIVLTTIFLFQNNHSILQSDFYLLLLGSACAAFILIFLLHELVRFLLPKVYAHYQHWLTIHDGHIENTKADYYFASRILTLSFFLELITYISLVIFFLYFFAFVNEYHNTNPPFIVSADLSNKYIMSGVRSHTGTYYYITKVRTTKGTIKFSSRSVYDALNYGDVLTAKLYKGNLGFYYGTEIDCDESKLKLMI